VSELGREWCLRGKALTARICILFLFLALMRRCSMQALVYDYQHLSALQARVCCYVGSGKWSRHRVRRAAHVNGVMVEIENQRDARLVITLKVVAALSESLYHPHTQDRQPNRYCGIVLALSGMQFRVLDAAHFREVGSA
jgi:hypothetical protein